MNEAIPEPLETLVMSLLSKTADRRPTSTVLVEQLIDLAAEYRGSGSEPKVPVPNDELCTMETVTLQRGTAETDSSNSSGPDWIISGDVPTLTLADQETIATPHPAEGLSEEP